MFTSVAYVIPFAFLADLLGLSVSSFLLLFNFIALKYLRFDKMQRETSRHAVTIMSDSHRATRRDSFVARRVGRCERTQ